MEPSTSLNAVEALLARIFLKEVDAALLRALAEPRVVEVFETLELEFERFIDPASWDEATFDDHAAEYARLFLLPGGASPYAAAWKSGDDGAVRAALNHEISSLYAALRLEPIDAGMGNAPSDHVGMLLSLCAAAGQIDASGDLHARARALLEDWAPSFAEKTRSLSTSPIYRAAARVLIALFDDDSDV